MTPKHYATWLAVARRHARVAAEAEDLLHDALLAAARADRLDLEDEGNRRWLTGVIRNQAALQARSAVRRRARESGSVGLGTASSAPEPSVRSWRSFGLEGAPRSARRVLALALHGMNRDEIRATLGLSPTAFRQRLVVLRRALERLPDGVRDDALDVADSRRRSRSDGRPLGPMRRALLASARLSPGLGTHDPDGHLLVLRPDVE